VAKLEFASVMKISTPQGEVVHVECNGTVVWSGETVNRVQLSIDTDGSIYNGSGFLEGYRLSSSGALKEQEGSVTTGFIPATNGCVIRMAGVSWPQSHSADYSYICIYDASFNKIGHLNMNGQADNGSGYSWDDGKLSDGASSVSIDENGVVTFSLVPSDNAVFSYIRINAEGNGADMIVTINQEIKY